MRGYPRLGCVLVAILSAAGWLYAGGEASEPSWADAVDGTAEILPMASLVDLCRPLGLVTNLDLPAEREVTLQVRPTVRWTESFGSLSVDPRLEFTGTDDVIGAGRDVEDWQTDLFLNGWDIRYSFSDEWLGAYSREDLQWGPSQLVSPSNPFASRNGRNQPNEELPGRDFLKLAWFPGPDQSLSLMVNVGEGEAGTPWQADDAYAVAVDSADTERQAQLQQIDAACAMAVQEAESARADAIGAVDRQYERWVAMGMGSGADRWRESQLRAIDEAYSEGLDTIRFQRDTQAALVADGYQAAIDGFDECTDDLRSFHRTYALKFDATADRRSGGLIVSATEADEPARAGFFGKMDLSDAWLAYAEGSAARRDAEALFGASYACVGGSTVALEYFFNESGNRTDPIQALVPPFSEQQARETFLRQNYLFLQVAHAGFRDATDLLLRWTWNLDDGSDRWVGYAETDACDSLRLFGVVQADHGSTETEFGSVVNYSITVGVKILL